PSSYPAGGASVEISLLEVDAAVAPRDPRLISRVRERRPGKRDVVARDRSGFDLRATPGERHGCAETVAVREALRISAPAALKLLCPDEYSGNGGVGNVVGW